MNLNKIKSIKASSQKGFTLIELMITVAIVGILAAVALPAYQDYTIRAQVSEGSSLIGGLQTAEQEYYANNGSFADEATLGITAPSGKYVSGITTANASATGVDLVVAYSSAAPQSANTKINGGTLTYTAIDDGNGNVHWKCKPDGTLVTTRYVPSSCTNS